MNVFRLISNKFIIMKINIVFDRNEYIIFSDKSFYRSTYSLVSPTRIENIDFDELERMEREGESETEIDS